ncbi:MAG: ATP synthase protein I [Halocynthiibacter sp.]|jgi:ATP synthase protein I
MIDPSDKDRLAALDARIKAAKGGAPAKHESEEHYSQANMAWRMVIELVAGLGIGFGVGFGLDRLLGTMPIFLILFVFLGFAAGIKTMMRTANEIQRNAAGAAPAEDDKD